MKLGVAFVCLFGLLCNCLGQSPQTTNQSPTLLGLFFSGNQSWLTGNKQDNPSINYTSEPGLGFKAGAALHHEISPRFFVETSLGYVWEQNKYRFEQVGGDPAVVMAYSDVHSSYSWLEMPFILNFAFQRKRQLPLFIGMGISVRRLINASADISVLLGNGFTMNSTVDPGMNEWNFFPTIQAGGHFRLSDTSRLRVALSYQQSISNWYRTPDLPAGADSYFGNPDFKQHSINLGFTYFTNLSSL